MLAILALASCSDKSRPGSADEAGFSPPTESTLATLERARAQLPSAADLDRQEAERGLVAREESLVVRGADGTTLFDQDGYRFLEDPSAAASTVHPSLLRQAELNHLHGLYEVTKGVHQVRGYDLANLTIIEGSTGLIVVDPLTTKETAERALAFARKHLGDRPVRAIVFTHSHVDHFGGALAIASAEEVASGKVRVIAPEGFLEEATSENVLAGPAMGRRATYMYGRDLPRGARARVDNGLGKEPAFGSMGILPPTDLVGHATRSLDIDGVTFEFQFAPGTEAPAELAFYLPHARAYCGAELVSRTLHNLITLRGAKARDARRWAAALDEAIDRFREADVAFMSHHWPVFGKERVRSLLVEHRDTLLYLHDQTLRLANQGLGPREIAEQLELPASLREHAWNRGYYGTVRHDAKGVYQMYFGWYDGNPANLDPLPRAEAGARYVELAGGSAALLDKARAAFERGDYRWVAEVVSHLVAAEPKHAEARELLARAFDQLGYVAESASWRNVYLSGAYELRHGRPERGLDLKSTRDLLEQTDPEDLIETLKVAIDGPEAEGLSLTINLTFTDRDENWVLSLDNSVLHAKKRAAEPGANATLSISRKLLVKILTNELSPAELLASSELEVKGSRVDLLRFLSLLDRPDLVFPLATGRD